jgi:uncharacterized OsmC-like protein
MIMLIAGNAIAAGHGAQADFWTPQAPNRSTRWIERTITLHGPLDDDRRAKLAEIAEKTPVTKAVRAGTEIRTTLQQT